MLHPRPARANGAFPDEFSIHFQPGAPHRILLGANFGLLISEDDGGLALHLRTLDRLQLERRTLEQLGELLPGDSGAVLLAAAITLTRSSDVACTWPISTGARSPGSALRISFPTPMTRLSFWRLSFLINPTTITSYCVASHDGGKTFDPQHVYETPDLLTGVEIARSKPGVFYATSISLSGGPARFLASTDSGANWTCNPHHHTALGDRAADPHRRFRPTRRRSTCAW